MKLPSFIVIFSIIVMMLFSSESYASPEETVAACLILEAGGEANPGMEAVMGVIKNRAKGSNDVAKWEAVVLKPKQFSCFNSTTTAAIAKAKNHSKWNVALNIVRNYHNSTIDYSKGATHYHVWTGSSKARPFWTMPKYGGKNKKAVEACIIGNHVFLRNVD